MSGCMAEAVARVPAAYAEIRGTEKYPKINGLVYFFDVYGGTIVMAEIYRLPDKHTRNMGKFFGFHICEESICTGDEPGPLAYTSTHFSPEFAQHPQHLGDLTILLSTQGIAWLEVYTGRFFPEQVIGRTVEIHEHPDDFITHPHGNAGERIACGEIKEWGDQLSVYLWPIDN
ncbi:superoxide dismutase family protein [Muricomes intestini]|uniref:superoxide dismutase family protein n=1 Tax=Muricomes intestini TaxID=1796634 RepID=UPI0026BDFFF6